MSEVYAVNIDGKNYEFECGNCGSTYSHFEEAAKCNCSSIPPSDKFEGILEAIL